MRGLAVRREGRGGRGGWELLRGGEVLAPLPVRRRALDVAAQAGTCIAPVKLDDVRERMAGFVARARTEDLQEDCTLSNAMDKDKSRDHFDRVYLTLCHGDVPNADTGWAAIEMPTELGASKIGGLVMYTPLVRYEGRLSAVQADSEAYTLVRLATITGARQQQLRCHCARMGQKRVGAGRQRGRHHGVPLEHTMRERRSDPGRAQNMAALVLAGSYYKGKVRARYNCRLYCMKQALGPDAYFNGRVFPLSGLQKAGYTGPGPGRGPSGGLHGPCGRRQ